jgi:four helix bundle protein
MPAKSYRDLLVWRKAMNVAVEAYRITADFPKNEEFGLKSQMRRAALSIPSNIAEGQARNHAKEFVRFIHVALGSLSELETQVDLSVRLEILHASEGDCFLERCREIGKMLHGLAKSVQHH